MTSVANGYYFYPFARNAGPQKDAYPAEFGSTGLRNRLQDNAVEAVKSWRLELLNEKWLVKHPRPVFQIWAQIDENTKSCSEVSIVFASTGDWSGVGSNARSIGEWLDSDYRPLTESIDEVIRKIKRLPCYRPKSPPLVVSVGTSLGGGLAQLAAFATDPNLKNPRIDKVFAFNPSPDTGYDLVVDKQKRNLNLTEDGGLEIDRVREHDEAISVIGKTLNQLVAWVGLGFQRLQPESFKPGDDSLYGPLVRNVAFDLQTSSRTSSELHLVAPLAAALINEKMQFESQQYTVQTLPPVDDCKTRYYLRTHPQEGARVADQQPSGGPEQTKPFEFGGDRKFYAQAADLGAWRGLYGRTQPQVASQAQPLLGPASAQTADFRARLALNAPVRTQLADLARRQAQLAPPVSPQAADLTARPVLRGRTQTQVAGQAQPLLATASTQAANFDTRPALNAPEQTRLADLARRQARLVSPVTPRAADLAARGGANLLMQAEVAGLGPWQALVTPSRYAGR